MKRLGACLLLILVACGKRGDPHPPIPIIPKATTDLVVAQRGAKVLLSWGYPALTTAGKNLSNIRRVVVYRATEPNTASPLTSAQFVRLRAKVDSIEGANLPAAAAGALLTFEDTPQLQTTDGRPVRLTYAVVTEGPNATSDLSNLAQIVPLDVPVPPSALTATPKAEGVVLAWTAPAVSITSKAKPALIGYNVYRTGEGQTLTDQTKPVNTAPVSATTYTDVPPYGTFAYVVTAIAGPQIESDSSPPVTVTFKDLTPPPAPQNVSLLIETKAVRLVWDQVQVPDLAGYRVWRREGVGHDEAIKEIPVDVPLMANLITTPYYVDSAAGIGLSYRYAVTAVDKSGNESERKWSGWVVIPKTP